MSGYGCNKCGWRNPYQTSSDGSRELAAHDHRTRECPERDRPQTDRDRHRTQGYKTRQDDA